MHPRVRIPFPDPRPASWPSARSSRRGASRRGRRPRPHPRSGSTRSATPSSSPRSRGCSRRRKRGGARFRVETRDGTVVLEGTGATATGDAGARRTGRSIRSTSRRSRHPASTGSWCVATRQASRPGSASGPRRSWSMGPSRTWSRSSGPSATARTSSPGDLDRQPSHLNDATAALYAWPTYRDPDSDAISGDLVPLGGETDLAGGWFDAGDFLKFTHTTAYADALLWAMQRELGAAAPDDALPGGAVRARLAGQGLAPRHERARPPGRHRVGRPAGHLSGRPRPVAPAGGGRRADRRGQPLSRPPARVPGQRGRLRRCRPTLRAGSPPRSDWPPR